MKQTSFYAKFILINIFMQDFKKMSSEHKTWRVGYLKKLYKSMTYSFSLNLVMHMYMFIRASYNEKTKNKVDLKGRKICWPRVDIISGITVKLYFYDK